MFYHSYKKIFLGILLTFSFALSVQASTKVDPFLSRLESASTSTLGVFKNSHFMTMAKDNSEPAAEVILKGRTPQEMPAVIQLIKSVGGAPRTVIQDLVTARIPLKAIESVASSDLVVYIEGARKLEKKMNVARTVTGVDQVQSGAAINGTPYKGKGVIVGVIDSGIDCTHADFKDSNGNSRILFYWDQNITGSGVPEVPGSSGVQYSGNDFVSQNGQPPKCKDSPDRIGHGTHVSGIAAGNSTTFTGVAPEADIIMVQFGTGSGAGDPFTSSVLDAVSYILQKAQQANKPVVINISLGTSEGAHDNSSLFEQGLNALLMNGTNEKPGAAIAVSAGNSSIRGARNSANGRLIGRHASINTTPGANGTAFEFGASLPHQRLSGVSPVLDIWLSKESICQIEVDGFRHDPNNPKLKTTNNILPELDMTITVSPGQPVVTVTDNVDRNLSLILDFREAENANNKKKHATLSLSSGRDFIDSNDTYTFDVIFRGNCVGDAWLVEDSGDVAFASFRSNFVGGTNTHSVAINRPYLYAAGDNNKTVTIPATASAVVTVGSFMDRQSWVDIDGTSHDQFDVTESILNDISTFSSLGPTADGRVKPEITAPGEPIISAMSENINPFFGIPNPRITQGDATHFKIEGTSMSAPHVTGMIALMLEKNPTLTHSQIKDLLKQNATKDIFTGQTENNTWGAGKLNAVATMNAIQQPGPRPSDSQNGGGGDSGCTLSPHVGSFSLGIFMILLAMGAIASVRFRKSE